MSNQENNVADAKVERKAVPVVFVTDLTYHFFDPADLFDIGFLQRSEKHDLVAVCFTNSGGDGQRVLTALETAGRTPIPCCLGLTELTDFLKGFPDAVNLVVTGGYTTIWQLISQNRALVRQKIERIFVVGGHINDYSNGRAGERLPIDPRLKERHSEYFLAEGDSRVDNPAALGSLLTSGEGIIWLPRDICLWRYSAPSMLVDGGSLSSYLLRELFAYHWIKDFENSDRLDAAEEPVLLSSLPGLLLATEPDPFAWMRLFRVVPARLSVASDGAVTEFDTSPESPNLYAVVAIDGQALSKVLTNTLRVRPLTV